VSERVICPGCGKDLAPTNNGRYRKHKDCDFSQTVIQEEACPEENPAMSKTASSARPSPDDAPESAPRATPSTESSPSGQGEAEGASTASAPDALPGAEKYVTELSDLATEQLEAYREKVNSGLTPFTQPTPPDYERPTLFSQPESEAVGTAPSNSSAPPAPAFAQPAGRRSEQPDVEMSTDAASIAARLKELFYSYDNRRSSDNRSAQKTMGPSEMGTPCDRRLALSLMRMPPVNPGGDGWAAFVGTAIHAALEEMFVWADAGTGRFAVEQRLEFCHPIVPKGTADLLDRTLLMILDHKCQGRWSRNKLKTQGPSPTYKVQAHVYAYGARLRGEKVEKIAIVSWPRDEATLDDLYVHVEDYNPLIAKRAFERVDRIGAEVEAKQAEAGLNAPPGGAQADALAINANIAAEFKR
jgi:hypothetical protein